MPDLADVDVDAARDVITGLLADGGSRELGADEAGRLLGTVGIVVSHEIPPDSVEVVLGVRDDPSFGALVSFGVAGVAIELLGDRAYAPVPLTGADAEELVLAPHASPLLTGYNGSPAMDLIALGDLVLRLSALAEALPELAECTIQALATPIGVHVAAVSARVAAASTRADTGPRRLRGL